MKIASAVVAVVFSVLAALLSSGAAAEQPTATSAARPATPPSSALTAAVTVAEAHTTVLPEMTVTASPVDDTSYNVPNATTATRTDTPIFDTPVSVQVVPKQVLEDQQVIALKDALKNVSGVQRSAALPLAICTMASLFAALRMMRTSIGMVLGAVAFATRLQTWSRLKC
ncbi:MAG: TonB-dependent receptor plug domain-containing protein [Gammaproteobacteria bacterium]